MPYSVAAVRGKNFGGAAAWSPTDISGLQLWLDFSDITTLYQDSSKTTPVTSDGDVIGCATDKSSSGDDATQSTTAAKPLYKTNIQNSLACAYFDGSDDFLGMTGTAISDHSVFVVTKRTGTTTEYYTTAISNDANTYFLYTRESSLKRQYFVYQGTSQLYDDPTTTLIERLYCQVVSGTSAKFYIDSVERDSDSVTNTSHTWQRIGIRETDSVYPWKGYILEILIYDNAVSDADRALIETWINDKWSIY